MAGIGEASTGATRTGIAGRALLGSAWHGMVLLDAAWLCLARRGSAGKACYGKLRVGMAPQVWFGSAWLGVACRGSERNRRRGSEGAAWTGQVSQVWISVVRIGKVSQGAADTVWFGTVWHGAMRHGVSPQARQGMAWRGFARFRRCGMDRHA